jgi:HSP20 family molecular chaperone IbpA
MLVRIRPSVKTEHGEDDNHKTYQQRERFVGEFQRLLTLPSKVDGNKFQTDLNSGRIDYKDS